MATRIRLTRHGSKKHPFYRIVAASTSAPRDGRFIEQLGHYDPTRNPAVIHLQLDKVENWMRRGAQPTETVARLMKKAGWKGLTPTTGTTGTSGASSEG
jgi:small subunit ribosomal protein S16